MQRISLVPAIGLGCLVAQAAGQSLGTMDHPTGAIVPYRLDGVAAEAVHVEHASWLRLYFDRVELTPGSFLRMTSALDGEVQELDAAGLVRWGNTSAYFNGDTVLVELVVAEANAGDGVSIGAVGRPAANAQPAGGNGECGICDADYRVPSA